MENEDYKLLIRKRNLLLEIREEIIKRQKVGSPLTSTTTHAEPKKRDGSPESAFKRLTTSPQKHENKLQEYCSPDTPNNLPSISPPPFSPLTPLVFRAKQKKIQEDCSPDMPNNLPSISPPPFSPLTPLVLRAKQKKIQEDCSPDTPNNLPSISPPPFSPLTPLVLRAKQKKIQAVLNPDKPLPDKEKSISPPLGSQFLIPNNDIDDPNSSPNPPMSPETQKLYHALTQPRQDFEHASNTDSDQDLEHSSDIIENTDISDDDDENLCEDSDDSVKDPDFITENIKHSLISETEEESYEYDNDNNEKPQEQETTTENTKSRQIETETRSMTARINLQENTEDEDVVSNSNNTGTYKMTPENKKTNKEHKKVIISETESDDNYVSGYETIEIEKSQEMICDQNSSNSKRTKNFTPVKEKNTWEGEINTIKKLDFDNTTIEESVMSKPLEDKNTTDTVENESQNSQSLISDLVDVTMNMRENRHIPDISIEDDTTNASLISNNYKEEDKNNEENSKKIVLKKISTENVINKQTGNFISLDSTEKCSIPPTVNLEDNAIDESVASTSNHNMGAQRVIPERKCTAKDNESLTTWEGEINTIKKLDFDNTTIEESVMSKPLEDKNTTDTVENESQNSQSLISDLVDVTMNIRENRHIPDISIEDDTTNASLISNNYEEEDKNNEENSKKIVLKKISTENVINKQTSNFISSDSTEKCSIPPTVNLEDNAIDESVASTSNHNMGAQRVIPERKCTAKDNESLTPTINEINTQNLVLEVNTEDDIRNGNAAIIVGEARSSETGTKKKRSRKERQESKILRNTGKSYVTEKGKVVAERRQEYLRNCRLKCADRITVDEQKQCFENYWQLGNRDRRAAFVSKSVNIFPKKTQKTDTRTKNRDCYCVYKLFVSNEEKPVCKECFCRILGETKGFVNIVVEKKKLSPTGLIDTDQRGLQPPKSKKTLEDLSCAINHISSFPSYESHYCRQRTGKKFLPADLSIAKMYREYKKTVSNPISLKLYAKCFHDLKLSFKQPSKDTCNTCDVLNAKIKTADEDRKINLTAELTDHQSQAEIAYGEKRADKAIAKMDPSVRAVTFDLQQCLPTPYLKTSVSFYKRQLWSFNLTIHDLANNEATCYMWDETIGARGANQIASCLWHFCNNLPSEVKEVIFYSDTCGGQNKNNIVAMMFMYLLNNHPTLQTIHHKFLISGHTHMECDSDHAIIEKTKKKTQMKINHLNDWVQLVRTCKIDKNFNVVVMTLRDFLDFSELKSKKAPFSIKKQDESGDKFLWQPIKWLKYSKTSVGKILFKHNLDRDTPFKSVNFKKRGKIGIESFRLNPISQEPLPISAEKKKDLMDLLELVDGVFHDFYLQIKTVGCQPTDPDLDEEDPDLED